MRLRIALGLNVNVFLCVHLREDRGNPRAADCQLAKCIKERLLYVYSDLVLFFRHLLAVLIRDGILCWMDLGPELVHHFCL